MAEAITYADLRFVKVPLKKSASSRLGQDPDAYEDGELTYENVQVPPVPGGASGLASSGLGDKAGGATCLQYLVLGLLLTCLLLGVAAICLGVRYLQVSQKLQQVNRVLEATNSSLRQQLRLKITQLGQKEEDLQESRRKLAQSEEALQEEQSGHQTAEEKLQACQSDREKTQETLQREEEQRQALQQRLHNLQNTGKRFLTCSPQGYCCPVGWIMKETKCFYFSSTQQSWEESQKYCKSLSSNLATFSESHESLYQFTRNIDESLLSHGGSSSYWIRLNPFKELRKYHYGSQNSGPRCTKVQKNWSWWNSDTETCTRPLPCICELPSFRFPDEDGSLQCTGHSC